MKIDLESKLKIIFFVLQIKYLLLNCYKNIGFIILLIVIYYQ